MLDKGFNGEFFEQVCKSTDFKNSHSMPTDDRLPPGRRGDLLLRTLANKAIEKVSAILNSKISWKKYKHALRFHNYYKKARFHSD